MKTRFSPGKTVCALVTLSITILGILDTAPSTDAAETDALTLEAAVDKALKDNPLIRMTRAGLKIAEAQLREARAGWFPLLQFSETFTRSNNPVFVFGSLLEQGRFGPSNFQISSLNNPDPLSNFRTALLMREALFDQLQTLTRFNQARLGRDQANLQMEWVEQHVRFETLRAYYGVLVAQAKKMVSEDAVKMADSDLKRIRDRYQEGLTIQSDLLAAEVQLAEFRQQLIESEGDVGIAYAALNSVLGSPVEVPQKVTGQLADKRFEVRLQEDLIRQALLQRPDYLRSNYQVRITREGVLAAKGEYLPRLDLLATYGVSGKDLNSGSSDYTISAVLSYNLFDVGRGARLSKARALESMASAEQAQLASQIRLEIVRALRQHISSRERLRVASQAIGQATEALRIVGNRYREGLTTVTELLRAETALVRAQLNLVASRYDYYVSYASVLLSSGQLKHIEPFL